MELCVYLKKLREVHGLTQSELAQKLHIKRSTYSAYETGRLAPPMPVIMMTAQLYQIPMEVFMQEIEYNGTSIENREEDMKEYLKEQELLHYYYSCNKQKRVMIQKYMQYIKNSG